MIQSALARHAGVGADAKAVAAAAVSTWSRVISHLTPVIGVGGVDALYKRSLHLTHASFPWLAQSMQPAGDATQSDRSLMDLRANLEARATAEAAAASSALLVTFVELLAGLIGESLTARLLRPAWALDGRNESDQEIEQ